MEEGSLSSFSHQRYLVGHTTGATTTTHLDASECTNLYGDRRVLPKQMLQETIAHFLRPIVWNEAAESHFFGTGLESGADMTAVKSAIRFY